MTFMKERVYNRQFSSLEWSERLVFYCRQNRTLHIGCAALRIVLVTVPRVSRSCEHCPDGFDLHLLRSGPSDSGSTLTHLLVDSLKSALKRAFFSCWITSESTLSS